MQCIKPFVFDNLILKIYTNNTIDINRFDIFR